MEVFLLLFAGGDSFHLAKALAKVSLYSFSFAVSSKEVGMKSVEAPTVESTPVQKTDICTIINTILKFRIEIVKYYKTILFFRPPFPE